MTMQFPPALMLPLLLCGGGLSLGKAETGRYLYANSDQKGSHGLFLTPNLDAIREDSLKNID